MHKFTPAAIFLAYMNYTRSSTTFSDFSATRENFPFSLGPFPWAGGFYFDQGFLTIDALQNSRDSSTLEFFNPQAQQMLIWGKHTLLLGGEYFRGRGNYSYSDLLRLFYRSFTANTAEVFLQNGTFLGSFPYTPPFVTPLSLTSTLPSLADFGFPKWSYCLYLLDYWRPTDKLLLELGVTYEANKTPNLRVDRNISRSLWSPRLGINYFITPHQVVRLGAYTALSSLNFQSSLMPAQVAGVPYDINAYEGAEIREAGASWEAQWTPKTFTVLRAGAIRVANQLHLSETTPLTYFTWKEYYGYAGLNQIIGPYLGLYLAGAWKRFQPYFADGVSYSELDGLARLTFWHGSGIRAYVGATLIYQMPNNLPDNLFALADAGVGYEFPHKRGVIFLTVRNIFNRHFSYRVEPIRLEPFYASRQITLKLSLYY